MKRIIPFLLIMILFVSCKEWVAFWLNTASTTTTPAKLYLPKDVDEMKRESNPMNTLTIILGAYNGVYSYVGDFDSDHIQKNSFETIRNTILKNKNRIGPDKLSILIKPSRMASYKNTVDILDEMTMNEIKRFTVTDITAKEELVIESLKN